MRVAALKWGLCLWLTELAIEAQSPLQVSMFTQYTARRTQDTITLKIIASNNFSNLFLTNKETDSTNVLNFGHFQYKLVDYRDKSRK